MVKELPADFDASLAAVLEPDDRAAAARFIDAATRLDDAGLRVFLELFGLRGTHIPQRVGYPEWL